MTPQSTMEPVQISPSSPLSADELRKMDAYWRACNYMCAGMLYLRENALLREPLLPEHTKNRLLGHWGSDPGQTFTWVHLNRVIRKFDLDMIYLSGPGHGAHRQRSRTAISKALTLRSIPRRARTKRACSTSSAPSPFPGSSAVIARLRFPARFTRAASLGTASRTRLARRSTIQT